MDYYLAVDIGASSGRHILGWLENGILKTEEVYRFDNGMEKKDGHLCWNIEKLFNSVLEGMKKCRQLGKTPVYMGIDTWAVDYVLLDNNENIVGATYGYRDHRTEGMDRVVYGKASQEELYFRTGIQKQIFNTIFQLAAHKEKEPDILDRAQHMLMIPDYLNFLLTGVMQTEYTNATTTGLVAAASGDWDFELIDRLGFPRRIFKPIVKPGTRVGSLRRNISDKVGYNLSVMLPATHDTGSAVLSVPYDGNGIYISSGTWSLMGIELLKAECSDKSLNKNMTNEGGFGDTFRYLKNIMGLWMIQSVRNEFGRKYSFEELCNMAEQEKDFEAVVDVNDESFLAPDSMTEAVKEYCRKNHFNRIPETPGQLAKTIYKSLSISYADTVKELEELSGRKFDAIYIVGGGCNADYLNRLTSEATGKKVYAGPSEATAIGNIVAQMIGTGLVKDKSEGRRIIYNSTDIKQY